MLNNPNEKKKRKREEKERKKKKKKKKKEKKKTGNRFLVQDTSEFAEMIMNGDRL